MSAPRFAVALGFALLPLCFAVACGGGGGGGAGAAAPGTVAAALPAIVGTAAPNVAASAVVTVPAATSTGLTVTGYGGLAGATFAPHADGSTYDYAEDVTYDFSRVVDITSFNNSLTVTPATAWTSYPTGYGTRIQVTMRKTPGVTYTLSLGTTLRGTDGSGLAQAATFHITTPANVAIPTRLRATPNEPYRYGLLAHLSNDSLGGANAPQIAGIAAASGARFVRLDLTGAETMPTATTTDFSEVDRIDSLLATQGLTVLPILEQYSTAAWQSNGASYPAIFASPQLYGQFVGTAVAHLRASAPQITRVELFNEPNLPYWWANTNAAYAADDGSATAAYMLAGYAAAKTANPAITVVGPALADGGGAVDARSFLTQMYASGCRTGACWDVLSVHPYSWLDPTYAVPAAATNRWQIYRDLQSIAVAHGDPVPHVMLTEWAFSTANLADGFDPQVQARYMALGFNLMLADPTVDGLVWTTIYAAGTDFWSRTAITDASYDPLPAETTLRAFAGP